MKISLFSQLRNVAIFRYKMWTSGFTDPLEFTKWWFSQPLKERKP